MKKLTPYLLSLLIGTFFGYLLFQETEFNVKEVFATTLPVKAFQIGVFNSLDSAENLSNKYDSIIIKDDNSYRVYYSILTNESVINRMEKYLTKEGINYYIKDIVISDKNLIKALDEYEDIMISGSDNILSNINKLIIESYEGDKNEN